VKSRNILLVTVCAWIVVIVALGYWQVRYAWHPGAFALFLFRDIPVAVSGLVIVVVFEFLLLRKRP
jgi:hypothetical protein